LKVKWFPGLPAINIGKKSLLGAYEFLYFYEIWWFLAGKRNWGGFNQPGQKAPPIFNPATISWPEKKSNGTIF
jgi:hypothetical protein